MTILYLGNGLFRGVWGILYDKVGFKKSMLLLFSMIFVTSSTFYFIADNKVLIMIYCIIISTFAGAAFTLIPSGVQEVYGVKYASEIYSITFYFSGVAAILVPVLSKSLGLSSSKTFIPYLIIYLLGSFLSIIGFIITLFVKLDKHNYTYKY